MNDHDKDALLKHAVTLLRASRYAIKKTAENPNRNHDGYYDLVHKLIAVIENHYDAPSVIEPNEAVAHPVSKEVSQSDEEIAKEAAIRIWPNTEQTGPETTAIILDAIRRAKEVSEPLTDHNREDVCEYCSGFRHRHQPYGPVTHLFVRSADTARLEEKAHSCCCCPVEVRGLYAVAFNMRNLWKYRVEDSERFRRKMPERMFEMSDALDRLQPLIDKHFEATTSAMSAKG